MACGKRTMIYMWGGGGGVVLCCVCVCVCVCGGGGGGGGGVRLCALLHAYIQVRVALYVITGALCAHGAHCLVFFCFRVYVCT